MYLAIIILPLFGSIASGFLGRKFGVAGAQVITCIAVVLTTLLAVLAFFEVGYDNTPMSMEVFRWIDSESLNVGWAFQFDSLTVSMLIPVLIVSSLVHIYSIGYMAEDPHNQRFFSYLSLFTFMMVILVTANNYLLMFVGWEGVGVCSYLLVSFWFTRTAANQSALSAFLTNRVGDCFLTIGMFGIILVFGNCLILIFYAPSLDFLPVEFNTSIIENCEGEALSLPYKLKVSTTSPIIEEFNDEVNSGRITLKKVFCEDHILYLKIMIKTPDKYEWIGVRTVDKSPWGWLETTSTIFPGFRGKGYGTEALKLFLKTWWSVNRVNEEINISTNTLYPELINLLTNKLRHSLCLNCIPELQENFTVQIKDDNKISSAVVQKCGFKISPYSRTCFESSEYNTTIYHHTNPNS